MQILVDRYKRFAVTFWSLITCLPGLLISGALPSPEANAGPSYAQVPWSQVSFQGSRLGSRISIDIDLQALPAAAEQARFIPFPQGAASIPPGVVPFSARGSEVLRLTVRTLLDPLGIDPVRLENHTWFDAQTGIPLHRDRLRRGDDDFLKTYRFTPKGVFRIQHQPRTKDEVPLPADRWTKINENFYPFDLGKLGCSVLSEMSHLIWVVAAADITATGSPLSVCAFGKRQLHRVRIIPGGVEEIPVDYLEVRADGSSARKNTTTQAVKVSIDAVPLPSTLDEPENFSVLGIQEDIVVFLDPISRVPVRVSGGIPGFGHAALGVQEVRLR